jgi:uncharacterized protein (TIGR02646 family)
MILVHKPTTSPAVLTAQETATAIQAICAAYDLAPDEYRSGARRFSDTDFDRSVYAAVEVREALQAAQHRKCAFCESFFDHVAFGDIEHFRPKGGFRQRQHDALRRPGYYWLVFEWTNLFSSCQLCNQRFKRNLFPLRDGRSRARSHRHNLANEEPLLIDPAARTPEEHIGFRRENAFAKNGSVEGATTIEVLGLNRDELIERRRDRLTLLEGLVWCRELLIEKTATSADPEYVSRLQVVEATLQASRHDTGEYAAMARAFLS